MPKVYHPIRYVDVPASAPHEGGTYRVSFGVEYWGGPEPHHVAKVQMVYDGMVQGRRSPSYPIGSDDFERVCEAMRELRSGDGGKYGRGQMTKL